MESNKKILGQEHVTELFNFEKVLDEFCDRVKREYIQELKDAGRVASGSLINSVRVFWQQQTPLTWEVVFEANDYWIYIEDNREPTKNAGDGTVQRRILQWIQQKGIVPEERNGKLPTPEQLSYAIANKIHGQGYKGGGYLKKVVDRLSPVYLRKLQEALEKDAFASYELMLNDTLGKLRI